MARTHEDLVASVVAAGVRDERVLDAVSAVRRDRYVPRDEARYAYDDAPVPIPQGQVTSQPSLVAMMVESLGLRGHEHVLEIGTGYGYQTALLARLAAFVWSVERFVDIADAAAANLQADGVANVEVVAGDGSLGLPEHAPYDAIVVSAAFPSVPAPLSDQLAVGGRLVQPIGSGGAERVQLFTRTGAGLEQSRTLTGARFVRLYGEHGFPA